MRLTTPWRRGLGASPERWRRATRRTSALVVSCCHETIQMGIPPQELRVCTEAKARLRRAQAAPGEARELAETPLKVVRPIGTNGTNGTNATGSSPIKANQAKSRLRGWEEASEWTVVSGQWLVAKEGGGIQPSQTQSNQGVLEITITITIRSSWPKVGPISVEGFCRRRRLPPPPRLRRESVKP
jgi:hypothetical protein